MNRECSARVILALQGDDLGCDLLGYDTMFFGL
jgi:hypothetical protein